MYFFFFFFFFIIILIDDFRIQASEIWSKSLPKEEDEEKTKEEEYDEYFADLFS